MGVKGDQAHITVWLVGVSKWVFKQQLLGNGCHHCHQVTITELGIQYIHRNQ